MSTINVLILCQRQYGTQSFSQERIIDIKKDVDYLVSTFLKDDNVNINLEYLTEGMDHEDDIMTYKMTFDSENEETNEFVKNHTNHYSFILIGGCPHTLFNEFNEQNVHLLSKMLKEGGKMLLTLSKLKNFGQWYGNTKNSFLKYFTLIQDDPKMIFEKTLGYKFKSRKSARRTSRKSTRRTSRKSTRRTSRKSTRKTSRKSTRKTSRKSIRKTSRKSTRKTTRR